MLTVIIPAFNEAERIAAVLHKTLAYAQEVLVVDDGSLDQTAEVARTAGAKVITQENMGYLAAVKRGFQQARGDIVLTMDADEEHKRESGDRYDLTFWQPSANLSPTYANIHPGGVLCPV